MTQADSRLRVLKHDDVTVIEFVDRNILDEANIQQIGAEIGSLIDNDEAEKLVISFSNVDHLSSAALGALITIHNKLKAKGGVLKLTNIDPQIYEVFAITKLTKLFTIKDDEADAKASFS